MQRPYFLWLLTCAAGWEQVAEKIPMMPRKEDVSEDMGWAQKWVGAGL